MWKTTVRRHFPAAARTVLTLALSVGFVRAGVPDGYEQLDARVRETLAGIESASHDAPEPLSSPLDAGQIGRLASRTNPEAIEALTRVRKELLTVRKELGRPDLEVKIEASDFTRVPAFNSMQGNMLALSRVFPLGGKLSRRALAAFHGARKAFHEYEGIVLDLLRDARGAVAELYSAEEQRRILAENITLAKQLAELARVKYTTGSGVQQDVLAAEGEAARYENEQLAMRRMADVARSMINTLLVRELDGAVPGPSRPKTGSVTAGVDQLEAAARARRPEMLAARAAVDRARAELGVAAAERNRPDLMGQVGTMQNPEGDSSSWQAMVSVNLPWFSGKRALQLEESAAGVDGERRRLDAVWNKTRFAIRDAMLRAKEAEASLALFRGKLVTQARMTLDSARANYETGQLTFLAVVDAQRSLKEASMGQVRAEAELERRLAELERVLGAGKPEGRVGSRWSGPGEDQSARTPDAPLPERR